MLNVAVKAARAAGAIINRAALDVESVRISQKQVNDFVTEVDHASEARHHRDAADRVPRPRHLGRGIGPRAWREGHRFVWMIDPLDGTTNFIHGFPVYCVSASRCW